MKAQSYFYKNKKWNTSLDHSLDSESTLIVIFFESKDTHLEMFEELKQKFPKSVKVGCSTAGAIAKDQIIDNGSSVLICKLEKSKFKVSCVKNENIFTSKQVGQKIVNELQNADLSALFILSEGLKINGTQLIEGIYENLQNKKISISGGLAGDGTRFGSTQIYFNGEFYTERVLAIAFYGPNIKVSNNFDNGWKVFGPDRLVTRSLGNIVYEIDHRPALDLYKLYLGKQSKNLPASGLYCPLALIQSDGKYLVRTLLSVDTKEKSLVFAGDLPRGSVVKLMKANLNNLVDAAGDAYLQLEKLNKTKENKIIFAISCVGRKLMLGQKTEDVVECIVDQMKDNNILVGFYSYGEIAIGSQNQSELHNQTMTLTALYEEVG